jgi:hypothetical protein
MKTSELTGAALDWAVAKCELELERNEDCSCYIDHKQRVMWERGDLSWLYAPSTDWGQAGPIIEREGVTLTQYDDYPNWSATLYVTDYDEHPHTAPTPLIAAMRCYVASKLGDEVEIPEELQ